MVKRLVETFVGLMYGITKIRKEIKEIIDRRKKARSKEEIIRVLDRGLEKLEKRIILLEEQVNKTFKYLPEEDQKTIKKMYETHVRLFIKKEKLPFPRN